MAVVELAQAIERDGVDGIWLTDFDMCGVEAARASVSSFPLFECAFALVA
jgi:alkanesulfonate monooxygenase SsuD/methylene tetrahydromethanopterin reductase-like flavin-dependent oxidoreductase (luciferase family)